ncbi:hypothetical protein BJ742DRAFT_809190 [Cladochytrium replicatum]|nr:hypothetical protein BJ742DRAFT_809190 [Cladochytrium replicatum]
MDPALKRWPKVQLHLHLEGALRLSTVAELAKNLAPSTPKLKSLLDTVSDDNSLREVFCITRPTDSLTTFLDKFWATQSLLTSNATLERVAYETCIDAYHRDGVVLLELRYSPQFCVLSEWNDHSVLKNGGYDAMHEAVLRGCQRAVDEVADEGGLFAVGVLVTLDRSMSVKEGGEVVEGVHRFRERTEVENAQVKGGPRVRIVGIDLANDELLFPIAPFAGLFSSLAEARANTSSRSPLGITVHAGEVPGSADNVVQAIRNLRTRRVGHGVQSIHSQEALDLIKKHNVLLEVNPLSNYLTGSTGPYKSHPIVELRKQGIRCCVSTDDPGIFDTTLIQEYRMLVEEHGFGEKDFDAMNRDALRESFLDDELKKAIEDRYFPTENLLN